MLEAWIIEEIKKQDRLKQQEERPRLPIPSPPPSPAKPQ